MKIPSSQSRRCFASVLISLIFSWGLRVHRSHVVRHRRSVFTTPKEIELRMRHKPNKARKLEQHFLTKCETDRRVFRFVPLGIGRDAGPCHISTANKKKKFLLEIKTTRIPLTAVESVDSGIMAKWTSERGRTRMSSFQSPARRDTFD